MKCPICDTRLKRKSSHCPGCGASYAMISRYASQPGAASSPVGFLLTWGIAIAMAFALVGYGAYVFFCFLFSPISSAAPVQSAPADHIAPRPAASDGCFAIADGALTFLPERWDDGPVLNIPDAVDGQTVTALAPDCFRGCTELTTIVLPETLQRIDANAFADCRNLRGLYLPETVEYIGTDAFAGCVSFESICIPLSVSTIAPGCFDDCASLLYINYGGTFESWAALYDDFITPFTAVICLDGSYYHGVRD